MAIGISIGVPIGLALGNIALGPAIGLPIGLVLGVAMEKEKIKKIKMSLIGILIGLILFIGTDRLSRKFRNLPNIAQKTQITFDIRNQRA